jgi:hypothetical protein
MNVVVEMVGVGEKTARANGLRKNPKTVFENFPRPNCFKNLAIYYHVDL